ncbi:MAG: potassium-transporting ATPase subunit A [Phycisphaerales bacterium]|nr:MAG: potassium-transporting ATPase subunit A [Phycisphaerales bacterium]
MIWTLPILLITACVLLSVPLGRYMAWAVGDAPGGIRSRLDAIVRTLGGSRVAGDQRWAGYMLSMLVFNAVMFVVVYAVLTTQASLPLNPDGKGNMAADLAFNTAASFTSNTNLQHYSGEQSLSYVSQLFAIMWLQFVSAATGIAALAALCRGLGGKPALGNFYRDLARVTMLILLPLALVVAVALVACGTPMTLQGSAVVTTLEGVTQTIARGPVAAVVAIKQIGTNGGGYFGPNSTHPFENPGFLSNIIENISILVIPMACVWMFGRIVGSWKQAVVVFGAMLVLYAAFTGLAVTTEQAPAPALAGLPVQQEMNLEGKELRFGASAGPLWAVSTTSTSNGSVNAMHDSLNPLTGLFPMIGMWLNVEFGGVGVGFINMFLFIITSVFIAGMMVGRTPEYLGKKVEAREMKLALLALLAHPLFILGGTALFAATPLGRDTVLNPGPHGLSEIVYEFSSAAANNGSGFEGLGDNTPAWNIATGVVMLLGRFIPIILPLAIAGPLASKNRLAESAGSFRTDSVLFGIVLLGVVLVVGALLFLPLGMLGPVAEHLAVSAAASGGQ